MTRSRNRIAIGFALLAFGFPGALFGQSDQVPKISDYGIPVSRPGGGSGAIPLEPPKQFVTRHSINVRGKTIRYVATAGETYLTDAAGSATGSIFSFSYVKEAAADERRPVIFVFNGGPGSSSLWLHMGAIGPRRVALDQEVNPSNVPPFGPVDNPDTLLDVADLVFIDPVGTGWSRAIGSGKTSDFWGVNEDADAVAQFIELWLTRNGRWNAPKYLIGESYGSTRAALLPRALMGGPLYIGRMRGITINGVVLLGTTLEARDSNGVPHQENKEALELPAIADTAWYYQRVDRRGRAIEDVHQEAYNFAIGEYAAAITAEKAGTLDSAKRAQIVQKLMDLTGLPISAFAKSLTISVRGYAKSALASDGLEMGIYDSRYTLPLSGSGNDPVADDPAMGRYTPGFVAAFQQMASRELNIDMGWAYGAIVWKDLLPLWNWKRAPIPQDQNFATDLVIAMRRTPRMQVLVASGYYDLATNSASAEYTFRMANPPAQRVTYKRYESGHMLYLGNTARQFTDDIRALIQRTQ